MFQAFTKEALNKARERREMARKFIGSVDAPLTTQIFFALFRAFRGPLRLNQRFPKAVYEMTRPSSKFQVQRSKFSPPQARCEFGCAP